MPVIRISALETHDLRRRVLREGTPSTEVVFDGDDDPTTLHLAVIEPLMIEPLGIVGVVSLMQRRDPSQPETAGLAYQLRGMATDPARRGEGIGTALLTAALDTVAELGAHQVWARARLTALEFYLRNGFEGYGPDAIDAATGLMHRNVRYAVDGVNRAVRHNGHTGE